MLIQPLIARKSLGRNEINSRKRIYQDNKADKGSNTDSEIEREKLKNHANKTRLLSFEIEMGVNVMRKDRAKAD